MTARFNALTHTASAFAAVLLTAAFVFVSTPLMPIV